MDKEDNKEYLELLAHKYREGTLTEEETVYFANWYNSYQDERLELPAGYSLNPIVIRERIHDKLKQRIAAARKGQSIQRYHISLAWRQIIAAASVLMVLGFLTYNYFWQAPDGPAPGTTEVTLNVDPGTNKAILTLSDGSTLNLDTAANGTIANELQTSIQKTADGQIIYSSGKNADAAPELLNTITTPKGGQFQVTLPDGTKVWLNAASSLTYPVSFNERGKTGERRTRLVELSGEAYFQVAKDKTHPFIVKTDKQTVEVLGTHFNINSYADEGETKTTLEEGSVRVSAAKSNKILISGQQAMLNDKGFISIAKADLETTLAWKDGKIRFKDADIATIMRQVARWYNVDVEYKGKMPDRLFNGGISRQSNLATLLHILEENNIRFVAESLPGGRKKIIVMP